MTSGQTLSRRRGRSGRWGISLLAVIGLAATAGMADAAVLTSGELRTWGVQTANEIDAKLRVPGTSLYAETANLNGTRSGGVNNRSFVWPASTQFRVLNMMARLFPATQTTPLKSFSDSLFNSYWSSTNGYRSDVNGGAKFYDDNAHVVVALAEAYRVTGNTVYLDRAKATQAFVMSGEDTAAGGGIYFRQGLTDSKDTISTLQGARGAAMLYNITGQQSYLTDALRLNLWAKTHVQQSNGLFAQGYVIATSQPGGVDIVNSAGDAISLNLELYKATNLSVYLNEAKRIANASLGRYIDGSTGALGDEGYWAYELADGLANLSTADPQGVWLTKLSTALEWLHTNKQDPNGHYGLFWGRNGPQVGTLGSWNLNEQAAVARAYLYTSTVVPEPTVVGLAVFGVGLLSRRQRPSGDCSLGGSKGNSTRA